MIIGLVGLKKSGKTTFFNESVRFFENLDIPTKELMIALKLKKVCSQATRIPLENFEFQELKENPFKTPIRLSEYQLSYIASSFGHYYKEEYANDILNIEFKTPREILQIIGTEFLRSYDKDIHVNGVISESIGTHISIVTDIRFDNELSILSHNPNTYLIYIERDECVKELLNDKNAHPSEKGVLELKDKCHYFLKNDGSIDNFNSKIKGVLDLIMEKTLLEAKCA